MATCVTFQRPGSLCSGFWWKDSAGNKAVCMLWKAHSLQTNLGISTAVCVKANCQSSQRQQMVQPRYPLYPQCTSHHKPATKTMTCTWAFRSNCHWVILPIPTPCICLKNNLHQLDHSKILNVHQPLGFPNSFKITRLHNWNPPCQSFLVLGVWVDADLMSTVNAVLSSSSHRVILDILWYLSIIRICTVLVSCSFMPCVHYVCTCLDHVVLWYAMWMIHVVQCGAFCPRCASSHQQLCALCHILRATSTHPFGQGLTPCSLPWLHGLRLKMAKISQWRSMKFDLSLIQFDLHRIKMNQINIKQFSVVSLSKSF